MYVKKSLRDAFSPQERARLVVSHEQLSTARQRGTMTDRASTDDSVRISNVLETGYLAVVADGRLTNEEYEMLGENFASWIGADVTGEQLNAVLGMFHDMLDESSVEDRLRYVAEGLDAEGRRLAFKFACAATIADGETDRSEVEVLSKISDVFGIGRDEAQAIFSEVLETSNG